MSSPGGSSGESKEHTRSIPKGRQLSGPAAAAAASAALRDFARGRPNSNRSSSGASTVSVHSARNRTSKFDDGNQRPPSRHQASDSSASPSSLSASHAVGGPLDAPRTPRRSRSLTRQHDPQRRPPPPPPQSRSRGRPSDRYPRRRKPQRPMLSTLGRDFSRYPTPSRTSSGSIPTTPLPPYQTGDPCLLDASKEANSKAPAGPADPEKQWIRLIDDRLGATCYAGDAGNIFPLYTDQAEDDDDLHNPRPGEEAELKPHLRHFLARQQLVSMLSLLLLILGLLCVFVLLPVLSYTGHALSGDPYSSGSTGTSNWQAWAYVNDIQYPLFKNIRTGLVDPRTPASAKTRKTFDGQTLELVFSDEFSTPNRTFYPGDDPYWTA